MRNCVLLHITIRSELRILFRTFSQYNYVYNSNFKTFEAVNDLRSTMSARDELPFKRGNKQMIFITHFVHPHQFFFKFERDAYNAKFDEMECDVQKTAMEWRKNRRGNFSPKMGDVVAAHILSWNKWIRAQVHEVIDGKAETKRYKLWAVDHGQFVELKTTSLAPLPEDLAQKNMKYLHQGGMLNYLPGDTTFSLERLQSEMVETDEWTSSAIKTTLDVLDKASNVFIETTCSIVEDDFHFVKLLIQRSEGDFIELGLVLEKICQAIRLDTDKFREKTRKIRAKNKFYADIRNPLASYNLVDQMHTLDVLSSPRMVSRHRHSLQANRLLKHSEVGARSQSPQIELHAPSEINGGNGTIRTTMPRFRVNRSGIRPRQPGSFSSNSSNRNSASSVDTFKSVSMQSFASGRKKSATKENENSDSHSSRDTPTPVD